MAFPKLTWTEAMLKVVRNMELTHMEAAQKCGCSESSVAKKRKEIGIAMPKGRRKGVPA